MAFIGFFFVGPYSISTYRLPLPISDMPLIESVIDVREHPAGTEIRVFATFIAIDTFMAFIVFMTSMTFIGLATITALVGTAFMVFMTFMTIFVFATFTDFDVRFTFIAGGARPVTLTVVARPRGIIGNVGN